MTTTLDHRIAVAKGAALLDEKRPNWCDEIDLSTLSLSSGLKCVLGQIYGSYAHGLDEIFDGYEPSKSVEHGFDAKTSRDSDYAGLADEWKRVINARLTSEPLADWERELLSDPTHYQHDVDSARESGVKQGRAEGIAAYREMLDKVANAADRCGISLTYADVVALTDELDLL